MSDRQKSNPPQSKPGEELEPISLRDIEEVFEQNPLPTPAARVSKPPPAPPRVRAKRRAPVGGDLSAKDLETLAAIGSLPPSDPQPAAAKPVPKPPRRLSSLLDPEELSRKSLIPSKIVTAPPQKDGWDNPPDSGMKDLRALASLAPPPTASKKPPAGDDLVEPTVAIPLAAPTFVDSDAPQSNPKPDSATASVASTRQPHKPASQRAPAVAAPDGPKPWGTYLLVGVVVFGVSYFAFGRKQSDQASPTNPITSPAAPTPQVASAPAPAEPATPEPQPTASPVASADPAPTATAQANAANAVDVRSASPVSAPSATASATSVSASTTAAPTQEFDKEAAAAALATAVATAAGCKQPGDPSGTTRVQVTFAPSGRVTTANVSGPPFAGTATGGCIARAFRSASVPPFAGDPVAVSKTVNIP